MHNLFISIIYECYYTNVHIKVLIIDIILEYDAHLCRECGNLICLRNLFTLLTVFKFKITFQPKNVFLHAYVLCSVRGAAKKVTPLMAMPL